MKMFALLLALGAAVALPTPTWAVFPFCSSGRCSSAPTSPQGIHYPSTQWVVPPSQLGGTVVIPANIQPFSPGATQTPGTVVYTPTQTAAEPKWWGLNNDSYGRNHVGLWVGDRYIGRLDPELGRWLPPGADERGWVDLADVGGLSPKSKGQGPMPRDYVPSKIGEQQPYGELKSGARSKGVDTGIEKKVETVQRDDRSGSDPKFGLQDRDRDQVRDPVRDRDDPLFTAPKDAAPAKDSPTPPTVFTQGPGVNDPLKKPAETLPGGPNSPSSGEDGLRIERVPGSAAPLLNFGIVSEGISRREKYSVDGTETTPTQAMNTLVTTQLSNDSRNPWLVVVGSPAARERVTKDIATSPVLAPWANRVRVAAFDPTNHRVKSGQFPAPTTADGVVIRYQSPSGHDLHLQSDYVGGAEALALALSRADKTLATRADLLTPTRELRDPSPGYDPRQVPDLRRSIQPGPDPGRSAGWWVALPFIAGVGGLAYMVWARRR